MTFACVPQIIPYSPDKVRGSQTYNPKGSEQAEATDHN